MPVEADRLALAPMAHLGVVHRNDALRTGSLADLLGPATAVASVLYVLQENLAEDFGDFEQALVRRAADDHAGAHLAGHLQDPLGVLDQRTQKGLLVRLAGPVDVGLALNAARQVGTEVVLRGPLLNRLSRGLGEKAGHGQDPVGDQVVGVTNRAPAQDVGGVHRQPQLPSRLQDSRLARQFQAPLEREPEVVVEQQLSAKQLQRALGERPFCIRGTKGHLPAQVVCRPVPGLRVRTPVVALQQQRDAKHARRHAGPAMARVIQRREVLVPEQVVPLPRQLPVERSRPDVRQVQLVTLEQRGLRSSLSKHLYPNVCCDDCYMPTGKAIVSSVPTLKPTFRPGL